MMQIKINKKALVAVVSFFAMGLLQTVSAEPASMIVWDAKTRNYIKQADLVKGEKIAKTCVTCHGVNGKEANELLEGLPSLSGQRAEYIFKQLMDYRQSKRVGLGVMPNFANILDKSEMASVAVWFSKQELPIKGAEKASDKTKKIVFKGDSARFVPACSGCHGLNGEGSIVDVPALAGMSKSYFKTTMLSLKSGKRHNDIYKRMRLIAQKLSDKEIDDLANYYHSIGQ